MFNCKIVKTFWLFYFKRTNQPINVTRVLQKNQNFPFFVVVENRSQLH